MLVWNARFQDALVANSDTNACRKIGLFVMKLRRGGRRRERGRSRGRSRGRGRRRGVRRGGGQVSIFSSHSPAIKTSEHFLIRSICDEALSVFGLLVDSRRSARSWLPASSSRTRRF